MRIDRWIRRLLPREEKFIALFEKDVENIAQASHLLVELLDYTDEAERVRHVKEIENLEHRGDEITHTIFRELRLTFITPLDREDIGTLAVALDNVMDNIDQAATAILLYRITSFGQPVRDLAEILVKSLDELSQAIHLLRDFKNIDRIKEACVRVNAYENQADQVFHRELGRLFAEEKDPIYLIKSKELLAVLESGTDRCEDAAVLIENVLVKHS